MQKDFSGRTPARVNRELVRIEERRGADGKWFSYGDVPIPSAVRALLHFSTWSHLRISFLNEIQPSTLEGPLAEVLPVLRSRL